MLSARGCSCACGFSPPPLQLAAAASAAACCCAHSLALHYAFLKPAAGSPAAATHTGSAVTAAAAAAIGDCIFENPWGQTSPRTATGALLLQRRAVRPARPAPAVSLPPLPPAYLKQNCNALSCGQSSRCVGQCSCTSFLHADVTSKLLLQLLCRWRVPEIHKKAQSHDCSCSQQTLLLMVHMPGVISCTRLAATQHLHISPHRTDVKCSFTAGGAPHLQALRLGADGLPAEVIPSGGLRGIDSRRSAMNLHRHRQEYCCYQ